MEHGWVDITAWHAQGAIRPRLLCLHGTALLIETPLEKRELQDLRERLLSEDLQDGLITPANQPVQLEIFTLLSNSLVSLYNKRVK